MRALWIPALLLAASLLLVVPAVSADSNDDTEGTSVAYDGTTYKYARFSVPTYFCKMTSFDAGTDTYMRVHSRLEGYPVQEILDGVLSGSDKVTTFIIPAEVEKMGSGMFEGCTSLEEIVFLGPKPEFNDTFSGVPSGVTVRYLERYASSWTGFTELTKSVFPVQTYEGNTCSFEYCEMDGSVTILRHIKGTDIQIPSKLSIGGTDMDVKYIGDSAFFYDETSTQDKITNLVIPEGIIQIGIAAFKYCEFLESASLPSTLKVIYDEAFRMPIDTENWSRGALKSITLPDGLEYIGFEAFRMNYSLKTVTVPDSVVYYGDGAFRVCAGMETITLGKGVTSLGESSFDNCLSLKEVNMPDTLTYIGSDCFNGDRSLISIDIPDAVEEIGSKAFAGCTSLSEIHMSDDTVLGNDCFKNTRLITLGITSGSGDGIIEDYMNDGGWVLPGMESGTKISLLVIDTEDTISVDVTGTVSGFIRLTEKAVNTVGGTYMDGTVTLTGADRASKTYGLDSDIWKTADVGTVTVISGNTSLGTVDNRGGTFLKGTSLTFTAVPKAYCKFTGWSDGVTDATRMVIVNGDMDIVASFVAADTRIIKIIIDPVGSGNYVGAGKYVVGQEANLSVTPADGYHLIGWSDGYVGANRIVKVTEDVTFTVSFGNIEITFDTAGGSVPVGPLYSNDGWKITLPDSSEVKDGKRIVAWAINGTQYAVGSQYEVHGPVTATAVWSSEDNGSTVWIWIVVGLAVAIVAVLAIWKYRSSRNREI